MRTLLLAAVPLPLLVRPGEGRKKHLTASRHVMMRDAAPAVRRRFSPRAAATASAVDGHPRQAQREAARAKGLNSARIALQSLSNLHVCQAAPSISALRALVPRSMSEPM